MSIEKDLNTSFKNTYQKTRLNIHFTHSFLSNKAQDIFKSYKLTPSQFNVLRILRGQYPKATSIGLIKERMIDKSSDVSRIVDRLLVKNLIIRSECKLDRRQKDVKISQTGLDLLSKMDICEKTLDKPLKHLNNDELTTLNNLLDKLRKSEILS
jgi:DNA-binding MarR family transcriptional regulator